MKPDCIVCDLDGTLADNSHRTVHLKKKPKDWNSYKQNMIDDKPINEVIDIVLTYMMKGTPIILATGREESHRVTTETWLYKEVFDLEEGFCDYTKMYMRKTGDYRPDTVVKKEMLDKIREEYNILFWIDDRPSVIKMLRENKVFVLDVRQDGEDF